MEGVLRNSTAREHKDLAAVRHFEAVAVAGHRVQDQKAVLMGLVRIDLKAAHHLGVG